MGGERQRDDMGGGWKTAGDRGRTNERKKERKKEEAKLTLRRLQWRGASGGVYLGIRHGVGCGSDDGHGGAGVCEITMGRRHRGARVYSIGEGVGRGYGSVLIWAAWRRVAHARDRHHACTFTACVQRHRLTFSLLSSTGFGGNFTYKWQNIYINENSG